MNNMFLFIYSAEAIVTVTILAEAYDVDLYINVPIYCLIFVIA